MNIASNNLFKISSQILDPLLAYDLDRNVKSLIAIQNPNRERNEDKIERIVYVLKSMRQEIEKALSDLETAEEFSKFFNEGLPEINQLEAISKRASVKRLAKSDAWESGIDPSYDMPDEDIDAFIEGKEKWDSGKSIGEEREKLVYFLHDVSTLVSTFNNAKKDKTNSKSLMTKILDKIDDLISKGSEMIGGISTGKPKKKPLVAPKPKLDKKKSPVLNLENKVEHYIDMLKQNIGNESKTVKTLREFFNEMRPAIEEEKGVIASSLPVLIRIAHKYDNLRPGLVPIIKKLLNK